jgi:two-component system response regulator GlrR
MKRDTATVWVTVANPQPDRVRFRRLRLVVVEGPDRGSQVEWAEGRVRVGKRPANELALTDSRVSGLHLEVVVDSRGVRLRDPGSTNGTWINGLRVRDVYLARDTRIRIGDTTLLLQDAGSDTEFDLPPGEGFGPLIGSSEVMRQLFARLPRIAQHDVPVLIGGETGAGKEVVARAIHEASPHAEEPFVEVACAAIPAGLIEGELFGYEKGAFTGADHSFRGAFERAGRGTIFLDELGEMPLALQPKLLRVLEDRQVRRLGSDRTHRIESRVIAATHRDIAEMVSQATFRADLYYRLAVAEIPVPPLRDRPEDIPLLVDHFMRQFGATDAIDATTLDQLAKHPWPGNVRELRNAVQRIVLLGESPLPLTDQPSDQVSPPLGADFDLPYKQARDALLRSFRRLYAERALARCGESISAAARLAGVDRMTFYRMMGQTDEDPS